MVNCAREYSKGIFCYQWISSCCNIFQYSDNFPLQTIITILQNICCHKWKPHISSYLTDWSYCQQSPPLALMTTFWENWLSLKHVVIPIKVNNHNTIKTLYSCFEKDYILITLITNLSWSLLLYFKIQLYNLPL